MSTTTPPRRKVLICTIMRNSIAYVDRWETQLAALVEQLEGQYECWFSVVENDSTDGTDEWLRKKHDSCLLYGSVLGSTVTWQWLSTDKLGTHQYGSVWSVDRLCNLANARQKCLDQVGAATLATFDKIAYVEVDTTYDPVWLSELILAKHPLAAGLGEPDIYSGWSLRSKKHPKESVYLYDTCATRQTKDHTEWRFDLADTWRAASLVKTDLGKLYHNNCLHSVWSTFNCFCVYNAKPFIEGARWGYVNTRLNTGQEYIHDGDYGSGWLECDTVQICEEFRKRYYNKIYLNTNCLVRHG